VPPVNVELVTCVMIQNPATGEVLVQNRKRKYPGYSFPGGHVEPGESVYDCAVREVKEETGLDVKDLKHCGIVHWVHNEKNERYLCFMYKTTQFSGALIAETGEGAQFWLGADALLAAPEEKFSSVHYALSPLFHECGRYSEAFLLWNGEEKKYKLSYL
jgi:8-oxo-dGTP diphosphatase